MKRSEQRCWQQGFSLIGSLSAHTAAETIRATTLLFQLIEQEVTVGEILPLALMRRGGLEVVEMELTLTSLLVGKAVRDLPLPSGRLRADVVRDNQAQVITGDTVLQAGDTVIVLATPQSLEQLHRVAR